MNEYQYEELTGRLDLLEAKLDKILGLLECGAVPTTPDKKAAAPSKPKVVEDDEVRSIEDLLYTVDVEGWFLVYGEEPKPARYMGAWGTYDSDGVPEALDKREGAAMSKALKDLEGSPVNGGTHVFRCVGARYSKKLQQTVKMYACIPV